MVLKNNQKPALIPHKICPLNYHLLHITLMLPRILSCCLDFCKICGCLQTGNSRILTVKLLWFRKDSSVDNALYSFKDEIVHAPKKPPPLKIKVRHVRLLLVKHSDLFHFGVKFDIFQEIYKLEKHIFHFSVK